MAAVPETPDPSRCPLCGGPNGCAMETQRRTGEPQPPCWCTRAAFTPDLLSRVPMAARDRACVCAACAAPAAR
ncbi:MAG TPA: cysteine-rich CWC family protein [Ramlibacter sp.]